MPVRIPSHSGDMIRFKTAQHRSPSPGLFKYLYLREDGRIESLNETVCDLPVRIVFGQHQNVRKVLVDHYGSRSPRISVLTREPLTCISLSGRTTVGSR